MSFVNSYPRQALVSRSASQQCDIYYSADPCQQLWSSLLFQSLVFSQLLSGVQLEAPGNFSLACKYVQSPLKICVTAGAESKINSSATVPPSVKASPAILRCMTLLWDHYGPQSATWPVFAPRPASAALRLCVHSSYQSVAARTWSSRMVWNILPPGLPTCFYLRTTSHA
jgi:hypothetical protein